jgi:hypothetical protein
MGITIVAISTATTFKTTSRFIPEAGVVDEAVLAKSCLVLRDLRIAGRSATEKSSQAASRKEFAF